MDTHDRDNLIEKNKKKYKDQFLINQMLKDKIKINKF
jgi:hypothetical protein